MINDKHYLFQPIIAFGNYYGMLIILMLNCKKTFESRDLFILEQISVVFALILTKKKRVDQIKYILEKDFLEDLLNWNFASSEEVIERAKNIGWTLSDKHLLMVVNLEVLDKESIVASEIFKTRFYPLVRNLVKNENCKNIVSIIDNKIIILLHSKKVSEDLIFRAKKLGNKIVDLSYKINSSVAVVIGISSIFNYIKHIPRSYNEAMQAVKIGREIYRTKKVIEYNELGFFPLLAKVETNKWKNILRSMLSELYKYDIANNTELVKTLRYLIEYEEDANKVAKKLYIHENTVIYRKKRIIEILKYNPFKNPYRLNLEIALMLSKIATSR